MRTSRTRLVTVVVASLAAAAVGSACGNSSTPSFNQARSSLDRDTDPHVPPQDLASVVAGNTAFAFDLYQQVRTTPGNLFYSPYSISLALAMTQVGARGDTAAQIATVMHFDLPEARLHPAWDALDLALASRGQAPLPEGATGEPFALHVANSLWGQDGYTFLAPFLDTLALSYGAGMNLVDFKHASEAARLAINGWVADQTNDKIKDLLPAGSVTTDTRLVITNAIYFKASWTTPFEVSATADRAFALTDGGSASVPTMHGEVEDAHYANVDGTEVVEVPYQGNEISMVIIAPAVGQFDAVESTLSADTVATFIAALAVQSVTLELPKFRVEAPLELTQILQDMGMIAAFGDADLSGIDGAHDLAISAVLHKAFVAVDEKGTEAAAATAVIVGVTSVLPPAILVKVDRPFVFLIRDVQTGAILFVGRVVDPR